MVRNEWEIYAVSIVAHIDPICTSSKQQYFSTTLLPAVFSIPSQKDKDEGNHFYVLMMTPWANFGFVLVIMNASSYKSGSRLLCLSYCQSYDVDQTRIWNPWEIYGMETGSGNRILQTRQVFSLTSLLFSWELQGPHLSLSLSCFPAFWA